LLEYYSERGYYEDAIVMFTVDHGEVMLERDTWHFEHSFHVWDGIMHIPLMVKRPDIGPARIDIPVTSTDLSPSLLAWLGFEVPEHMHGVVLTDRADDDILYMENGWPDSQYAVVQGSKKWFASASRRGKIVDRWFVNLDEDPAEKTRGDWYGSPAERELKWRIWWDPDHGRKGLSPLPTGQHTHGPSGVDDARAEQEAILKALGYMD
jgi:arylsulfatase A-like enzyme